MTYLMDTGVWLRAVSNPETLPSDIQRILDTAEERGLSAISLWEIGKKYQIGKLDLNQPLSTWLTGALPSSVTVLAISVEVVTEAMQLPAFPNRDPADELIVATARVYDLTLLTTDTALKGYRHARIHYFKPVLTEA